MNEARRNAYDLHRSQYNAGVVGGVVSLTTGTTSGVLGGIAGYTNSGGLSVGAIIGGVLSLGGGIYTLIAVNKSGIEGAEKAQAESMNAWGQLQTARKLYTPVVIEYNAALDALEQAKALPDTDTAKTKKIEEAATKADAARLRMKSAIDSFYNASIDCGLNPGPAGMVQ
jgi:hypothetical protein